MTAIDSRAFRDTMSEFGTGVVIATGCLDGEPAGFAAQSFVSLSIDPPLIALCPGKGSSSWPKLRASGRFCINVLSAEQKAICDAMARPGGNKFAEVSWRAGVTGSPILDGALAYIDCELEAEHDAGDHTIAVGRVVDLQASGADTGPLLFFRGAYGDFAALNG